MSNHQAPYSLARALDPHNCAPPLGSEVLTCSFESEGGWHTLTCLTWPRIHFEKFTTPFTEIAKVQHCVFTLLGTEKQELFFFSMKYIFFSLGICNMPAIRSSKHETKKQGRRHRLRNGYEKNFTIYSYRNTKPKQTKQAHNPFYLQISFLCSIVSQSLKAEIRFNPMSQVSRPVSEPKSCHVTSENPSDPKGNASQMLRFPLWTSPIPIMQKQYFKLSRMLHSSHGIKISQKNTLEKIFSLWIPRLLRYGILTQYIQTAEPTSANTIL